MQEIEGLHTIPSEVQFVPAPQICHHLFKQNCLGPVVIDNQNAKNFPRLTTVCDFRDLSHVTVAPSKVSSEARELPYRT